jgi:hypothetical protein
MKSKGYCTCDVMRNERSERTGCNGADGEDRTRIWLKADECRGRTTERAFEKASCKSALDCSNMNSYFHIESEAIPLIRLDIIFLMK